MQGLTIFIGWLVRTDKQLKSVWTGSILSSGAWNTSVIIIRICVERCLKMERGGGGEFPTTTEQAGLETPFTWSSAIAPEARCPLEKLAVDELERRNAMVVPASTPSEEAPLEVGECSNASCQ